LAWGSAVGKTKQYARGLRLEMFETKTNNQFDKKSLA
jgi:hypothetical protein